MKSIGVATHSAVPAFDCPKALSLSSVDLSPSQPLKHHVTNESTTPTLLSAWCLDDGYIIARHEKLRLALEFLCSDEMRS